VTALITGVSGQDGIILAELLLARGVTVTGTTRSAVADTRGRMAGRAAGAALVQLDLTNDAAIRALIRDIRPTQLFHLAAPAAPMAAW
jgi:GDPmannose 4,6-dehydratase